MALRNAQPAAAEQTATPPAGGPAFEEMDEGTTTHVADTSKPAANEPATAAAPAAPAAAAPATGGALAAKAPGAVALKDDSARKFAEEVQAMKGAADFSWGNYKVFKGNNGDIISGDDKTKLGRWVKVSMLAWDDHYEVSPNSKSDKSKDALAFSKDGKVVDRTVGEQYAEWAGKPIAEYVKFLKEECDYVNANDRRFIDVACIVHECDANEDFAGEVIQITLSQSSIPSFSQYQEKLVQKARALARGIPGVKIPEDPFTFYFLREVVSDKDNTWTKLKVVDRLPAKF